MARKRTHWPHYINNMALFDSRRDIEFCEIEEMCEGNDRDVPKKNDWQDENYQWAVDCIREDDKEYFNEDLDNATCNDDYKILTGCLGLWDGKHKLRYTITQDSLNEILEQCLQKSDAWDYKVTLEHGVLTIYCYHHDGCNIFEVRKLSKKGIKALVEDDKTELKKEHVKRIKWDCHEGCLK